MKNNSYKSFLTGAMIGALGLGVIGMTVMSGNKNYLHKAKNTAAQMTSKISHNAGAMISDMGDSLADKIR
ncbi:MAG: hypothetical protein RR051_03635 [Clostridiales bacterium]